MTFTVPGKPVAKGRPRPRFKGGGMVLTPKTENFQNKVAMCAIAAGVKPIEEGPVSVTIIAHWEWPKSKWRKTNPRKGAWRCTGPDGDNIAKGVLDGLNGIAYNDDRQVAYVSVSKRWTDQGKPAHTFVEVCPIEEIPA